MEPGAETVLWKGVEARVVKLLFEPGVNGLVVTLHDVTERRHQALHDALTGLPNRVLFAQLGQQPIDVTVSVGVSTGIAHFPANGDTLSDLLMKADAAMILAKRSASGYTIAR